MQRPSLINHLETYLAAVYSDLLVVSLVTVEHSPDKFDLVGLIERYIVGVRWTAEFDLAGHLDCNVDKCPLPGPDLLTRNFAESPHLSVWLEGVAESAAVPLRPACMM